MAPRTLIAVAACTLAGCTAPLSERLAAEEFTPRPTGLAGRRVIDEASALSMPSLPGVTGSNPGDVRTQISLALQRSLGSPLRDRPMRWRITRWDYEGNAFTTFVPCFGVLIAVGCPTGFGSTELQVEVEVDGRRYSALGHGSGPTTAYTARGEATTPFFEEALAHALRQIDAEIADSSSSVDPEAR